MQQRERERKKNAHVSMFILILFEKKGKHASKLLNTYILFKLS